MQIEKRYTTGRYTRTAFVVFDRGPKRNAWKQVAYFGSMRAVTQHDEALAHDLADELEGVVYVPPVLRA